MTSQAGKDELLPCPFCGGKAKLDKTSLPESFGIGCDNDECSGWVTADFTTPEQAIASWNRRPPNREAIARDAERMAGIRAALSAAKETLRAIEIDGRQYGVISAAARARCWELSAAIKDADALLAAGPAQDDVERVALAKIERLDVEWVSSFDIDGRIVVKEDPLNCLSLVLGPAGEIASAALAAGEKS